MEPSATPNANPNPIFIDGNAQSRLILTVLQSLAEGQGVISAALDTSYRYTFFTQAYQQEIFKLTGRELTLGVTLDEIFSDQPLQLAIAKAEWDRTFMGETFSKTIQFGDENRYMRNYEVTHTPIFDEQGNVIGGTVLSKDVTSRTNAEAAWAETAQRYQFLFDGMNEGFAICELLFDGTGSPVDFKVIESNPAFCQLLGQTNEEILGVAQLALSPDDAPAWLERLSRVVQSGEPVKFEEYSKRYQRYFEVYGYRLRESQFAVILNDITKRKSEAQHLSWLASFPLLNPLPVVEMDEAGQVTFVNPAARDIFQVHKGETEPLAIVEVLRQAVHEIVSEGKTSLTRQARLQEQWLHLAFFHLPGQQRIRVYGMDITERVISQEKLQALNANLEGVIAERTALLNDVVEDLRQDILKRQQSERLLEAEKKRFTDLLEILPAYLILLRPDHTISFANRFFKERFPGMEGLHCYEYLFQRDKPCDNCESYRPLVTGQPHIWEWDGPDGHVYNVHDHVFVDTDGTGLILEMGLDITDVRRAQERVQDMFNYNRSLIEANQDILATIDENGKIGDVNAAVEAATGYTREELVGTDFSDYYSDPEKARQGYQQVLETGSVRNYELEIRHKDGHTTPVTYNASFYWGQDGKPAGVLAVARDLTELKQKEKQLTELNLALEEFIEHDRAMQEKLAQVDKFTSMGRMLASITHEINNPLQTIKNCLFLIQSEVPPNTPAGQFLVTASEETQRISNLVAELREIYRPSQGAQPEPVALDRLLEEVHNLVSPHLASNKVNWHLVMEPQRPGERWEVAGSADQFKQVFLNLSMNAIEAMQGQGGDLSVMLRRDPSGGYTVCFTDTGQGIPPENLTKVFEPFFTTKSHGLGLGLPINYDIVQRHNGHIKVSSKPGLGATFEVWLPEMKGEKDGNQ